MHSGENTVYEKSFLEDLHYEECNSGLIFSGFMEDFEGVRTLFRIYSAIQNEYYCTPGKSSKCSIKCSEMENKKYRGTI